ncbi:MAG: 6-pyruvoyl tetrahydropterin synthase family protein [Phycisphaerae bacterium]
MYTIAVEATFYAVHRVLLSDGTLEPVHGHDWGVRACFASGKLDERGMVVDFQEAKEALQGVLGHLHRTDLNESLSGLNPTAECVAAYIFEQLDGLGFSTLRKVEVTEAVGCTAMFEPAGRCDV